MKPQARRWMIGLAAVILSTTGQAEQAPPPPAYDCQTLSAHRAFDFWLGHWQVTDKTGDRIYGHNRIVPRAQGCVLDEAWRSSRGSEGQSSNYYHPGDEQWHQHWVDGSSIIDIAGGLEQGAMVMSGTIYYLQQQRRASFRGSWTPLADGRVRQYFEEQDDKGQWQPWFEGFYRRVEASGDKPGKG